MGLFNRFGLHIADKYIATQMQGGQLGMDITKDMPIPVKAAGIFGGLLFGTVVGVARAWNPLDIADSLLTPEKELQERVEKKMNSLQ